MTNFRGGFCSTDINNDWVFYIFYNRYEESTVKNNYIGFLSSTLNYQDRCSEQRRHFCCFWPYSKGNTFSTHQRSRLPSILYKCSTVYYNTVYERCWHISCELSSSQGWKTELLLRQISRERIFEKEVLKISFRYRSLPWCPWTVFPFAAHFSAPCKYNILQYCILKIQYHEVL